MNLHAKGVNYTEWEEVRKVVHDEEYLQHQNEEFCNNRAQVCKNLNATGVKSERQGNRLALDEEKYLQNRDE